MGAGADCIVAARHVVRPAPSANAERLLSRLEGVQKAGRGWISLCPAHQDRSPSLSITIADDGRILIHDFAGCDVTTIVAAIGLHVSDLFERRATHGASPPERAALREFARQADWRAALAVLDFEAKVVQIAAADVRAGRLLDDPDSARLDVAIRRISDARGELAPSQRFRPEVS
jgi:hypothetical protein